MISVARNNALARVFAFPLAAMLFFTMLGQPAYAASENAIDGEYTIAVTLEGGSGRAEVSSPAPLKIEHGVMTLTVTWSSANYDKMVVDGVEYAPVNQSGNSVFEIPVTTLNGDVAVSAETTAMSEPHTIDYTLHLDGSTMQSVGIDWTNIVYIGLALAVVAVAIIFGNRFRK